MTSQIKELFNFTSLKCIYGAGDIDQLLRVQATFTKGSWFNFQHLYGS